jgi:SAM-dependent methyltransferase
VITEVRDWVAAVVAEQRPEAPVLEVGSYNVNGTVRDLFPQPYVGLDMREGPGVDVVADVTEAMIASRHYGTVVCVETLEHVAEPQGALYAMQRALRPGGLFVGTWPFIFEVHDYPSDYWRVTPAGFAYLLDKAGFVDIVTARPWTTHVVATARCP